MEIVAADIGGTHARFAIAEVADGRVTTLGEAVTLKTAEHGSLRLAWERFARTVGRPLPRAAALAVASPLGTETIRLTNNPWIIRPDALDAELGLDDHLLVNDFGAVAHAVQHAPADAFARICGPDRPLPETGAITICGPGTGLGVALLLRVANGYHVIETEGGHIDFAPLDAVEDTLVALLRTRFGRVSTERVCAGPGLASIYETLAAIEARSTPPTDERAIWDAALAGSDSLAAAALDRFCLALGSVAGDLALTQGACAVVIAGGLGQRLKDVLPASGFVERFTSKGRFRHMMGRISVSVITLPEPGLFGAAAAFAQRAG
jgi:glucokinase